MAGAAGGVGVMAGLTPEEIRAWVEASCTEQGVPVAVSDPSTLDRVVVLLAGGAAALAPQRGRRGAARGSELPDGTDAGGVEASTGSGAWADDGVVEDGGDDGLLTIEVEGAPLAS